MKRMRLSVTYVALLALIFSLGSWFAPPTLAVESQAETASEQTERVVEDEVTTDAEDSVQVTVRVESDTYTVVPPTQIDVTPFDIGEYTAGDQEVVPETPRAIHAIIRALERNGIDTHDTNAFSLGYGGNYIHGIDGLFEFDRGPGSGWMYYIDHEYVPVGVLEREIHDGESIVVFYTDNYMDNTYAWFEEQAVTTETETPTTLHLNGLIYDVWTNESVKEPVEGATLLVDDQPYEQDGEALLTDADGKVEVTFSEAGTYFFSAERKSGGDRSYRNISRPFAQVIVEEGEEKSGLEQPGETAPVIKAEGLSDGMVVNERELVFSVTAHTQSDEAVTPVVELNGETVQPEAAGRYRLTLCDGENIVTVHAEEHSGHKTSAQFTVIYQKGSRELSTVVKQALVQTKDYIKQKGIGSDWEAIGLALSGEEVPDNYKDIFRRNLDGQVLNPPRFAKITDIERLALAAQAIGLDPTDVNGDDLIARIYHSADHPSGADTMTFQGMNGPIFALIAFDSGDFEVPDDARWTRGDLIRYILDHQRDDGSWALSDLYPFPSYDITAMALIALGPYRDDPEWRETVVPAIERAVEFLSDEQTDDGGFDEAFVGGVSSEATSQAIIGLTASGEDPTGDKFTKQGGHLLDHLLRFQAADGGFKHVQSDTGSNAMATEQALQALVAYERFVEGRGPLYDFTEKPIPEMPWITVEGLEDGMKVTNAVLTFRVNAYDIDGESLEPTVRLNGKRIPSVENNTYRVSLSKGENEIDVRVTGAGGVEVRRTFTVIYEEAERQGKQPKESLIKDPITHPVATNGQSVTEQHDPQSTSETSDSRRLSVSDDEDGHRLPDTATHLYNALLIGCLMLAIGSAIWIKQHRKKQNG